MSSNNYFDELEKIANETITVDYDGESMNEDPNPPLSVEDVESIQGENSEVPTPGAAEVQLPPSPDESEELGEALADAELDLKTAKEKLAKVEKKYESFEKQASQIDEELPYMGALAQLLDYSSSNNVEEPLQKLAQDRLLTAFQSDDDFQEVLTKTAHELFEDEQARKTLYSMDGLDYVLEQLASFVEDEELSKTAADVGGIFAKTRDKVLDYINSARNLKHIQSEIDQARIDVEKAQNVFTEARASLTAAKETGDAQAIADATQSWRDAKVGHLDAEKHLNNQIGAQRQGQTVMGVGGAGLAGGALYGGKKIYDALHPEDEIELSGRVASDNINANKGYNFEGGLSKMANSIVHDYLKVAGAAALLDISNDEKVEEKLRKEAADTFNAIARMNRKDMDDSFQKVATQIYSEDQLHEIVAGQHNERLFDKIAFFTNAHDMSADELEKIAGAESVAAKGVAGALTDAQSNIEAYINQGKNKAETDTKKGNPVANADDTSRYNVINNPGAYKVEKSAEILQQAFLQKEAAWNAFVEAENYIRSQYR